mgnify:CR=1 FL=1
MQKKKILLVARVDSVHTARWVQQINNQGWQIFIYPSTVIEKPHPDLMGISILLSFPSRIRNFLSDLGLTFLAKLVERGRTYYEHSSPNYRLTRLKRAIAKIRPDMIHAMEMQSAGYLTLDASKSLNVRFPPWLMTIWGSDIFLFGRLQDHRHKIQEVLSKSNFFSCECARDVELARKFGFEGVMLPELPVSGGFDLAALEPMRSKKTSSRQLIMLKGYQGWSGRALVGLHALERCADLLSKYTIVIFSASPEVTLAAELLTEKTGILIRILSPHSSHQEILELHGQARISMGLGISDGISVSLQEAMVMGSFPIQSCTACANEWIKNGVSGFIVPPEDPQVIEAAIRKALTDDTLVDDASEINWEVALNRLDQAVLKQEAVDMYRKLLAHSAID